MDLLISIIAILFIIYLLSNLFSKQELFGNLDDYHLKDELGRPHMNPCDTPNRPKGNCCVESKRHEWDKNPTPVIMCFDVRKEHECTKGVDGKWQGHFYCGEDKPQTNTPAPIIPKSKTLPPTQPPTLPPTQPPTPIPNEECNGECPKDECNGECPKDESGESSGGEGIAGESSGGKTYNQATTGKSKNQGVIKNIGGVNYCVTRDLSQCGSSSHYNNIPDEECEDQVFVQDFQEKCCDGGKMKPNCLSTQQYEFGDISTIPLHTNLCQGM